MDNSSSHLMNRRNTLTALSLFSGAGGMDVGFDRAGFETLLANDIDRDACATYRQNHAAEIIEGDLIRNEADFLKHKGVDLVFGGPPCQGFSVAGKMDPEDERSQLIRSFFDVVEAVQPAAFVCENVKALAQLSKWKSVRDWIREKVSSDYTACMVVLDSSKFGVPQRRERVFVIGIHRDMWPTDEVRFERVVAELLKAENKPAKTVRDIVVGLGRAGGKSNPRVCNARITFAREPVLRRSPYAGMLFNGAGRPLKTAGFASTLPASMGGNKTPIVDEGEIFDGRVSYVEEYHRKLMAGKKPLVGFAPGRLRRLTVDECLKFQTFPPGYLLSGRQSSMYRQIGNAVPSDLAYSVAVVVKKLLASGKAILPNDGQERLSPTTMGVHQPESGVQIVAA